MTVVVVLQTPTIIRRSWLTNLRQRSPLSVVSRKRQAAREWNAFVIDVDDGRLEAFGHETLKNTRVAR